MSIGDVTKATQAQFGVLAAAIAIGGDETNIQPGIDYFKELGKEGRMTSADASIANLEKGEIDVAIVWDFNGLNYRDQIDTDRFDVTIPTDGSVIADIQRLLIKMRHIQMLRN